MKAVFLALALVFAAVPAAYADKEAAKETKKVCVDLKDKDGKPQKDAKGNTKQSCKEMKVHKKLEGTEVPPKK